MKWVRPGMRALVFAAFFVAISFGATRLVASNGSFWMDPGTIERTILYEGITYPGPAFDTQCVRLPQKENQYRYNGRKWVFDKSTIINDGCWTKTNYGLIGSDRNGWYMRQGHDGPVARFENMSWFFVPIPQSDKLVRLSNNGSSFFRDLYIYENPREQLQLITPQVRGGTYEIYQHNPNPPYAARLNNPQNPSSSIYMNVVGVSNNGKWMVVEGSSVFFRLNLETKEILSFENPIYSYGYGSNPGYNLAISNDGKYATIVTGGNNTGIFNLYDLSTCTPKSDKVLEVATGCGKRSLKNVAMPNAPWNAAPGNVAFSDSGENIFYNYSENGKMNRYMITAPGQSEHLLEYLALGDSFSSGEGDENDLDYVTGTNGDGEGINNVGIAGFPYWREKCHLSDRSYPYLLGSILNNKFRSIACSGADLNDLLNTNSGGERWERFNGHYDQMDLQGVTLSQRIQVKQDAVNNFIPGRAAQIEFIQKYKPRVVTVGIGGNDIGFGEKLAKCVVPANTCEYASTNRAQTGREISQLYDKLVAAYTGLKNASPTSRFYAVGYPQLFTTGGECAANVLLDAHEREYATMVVSYLDKTIAAAAAKAGIYYLDVQDALAGNSLCSSAGKIAVNGLSRGDDRSLTGQEVQHFGFVGNESYHPNQVGHALIAAAIKDALSNQPINVYNPCEPSQALSCNTSSGDKPAVPAYFNVTGDEISTVNGVVSTADAVAGLAGEFFKRTGEVVLETTDNAFQKLSEVDVFLHSNPVSLGKFTTDTQGKLTSTVTIPATVEPGYHTLHVVGMTQNGEKVDYYKDVFIYVNENDWDGDGTANHDDKCGFVEPINEDKDEDGTDDACDGFVGDPQSKSPTTGIAPTGSGQDIQSNSVAAGLQRGETAVVYDVLASDSLLTLGHVAGTSTTKQVNYFDGPAKIDAAPTKSVENTLLTTVSVVISALLSVVLIMKFRRSTGA